RRMARKPTYSPMTRRHSASEGASKLRAMPGFHVDEIKEIKIGMTEAMLHHGGFKLERPATAIGAQMNHCYVVAVTLIDGTPTVPQFAPDRINSEDVWNLLARIHAYQDLDIDQRGEEGRWGTRLSVT